MSETILPGRTMTLGPSLSVQRGAAGSSIRHVRKGRRPAGAQRAPATTKRGHPHPVCCSSTIASWPRRRQETSGLRASRTCSLVPFAKARSTPLTHSGSSAMSCAAGTRTRRSASHIVRTPRRRASTSTRPIPLRRPGEPTHCMPITCTRSRADWLHTVATVDGWLAELQRLRTVVCVTAAENYALERIERQGTTGPEKYAAAGVTFTARIA